jgi:ankyrin repeat protein
MERRKYNWNYYPKHATSLYYAASYGIEHVVNALLAEGAEVDATGGRLGATAFHAAALRGHLKVMKILFQKGAEVNKSDFIEFTPLHSAALGGHLDVIRYLLDHGADPDMRDDHSRTPHDWAVMLGNYDVQNIFRQGLGRGSTLDTRLRTPPETTRVNDDGSGRRWGSPMDFLGSPGS